jgi:UDP-N-acetylmuramoylalanine--D-glutamate ligase
MDTKNLQNKLVAVLGYGIEGKAVTKYLLQHGISPVLFDAKPWSNWSVDDQEKIKALGVNFIFGEDYLKELKGFDVIFRSPGVKLSDLKDKLSTNAILTSQTKWFFEYCPAKIIGVTGTKGKGTTCALIYEILKADGKNAYLTGNIGQVQPLEILDNLKAEDFIVYELSSFQLQDLTQSPHIAVVLMVTSEHLDYHKNLEEYVNAKANIAKFQTKDDFLIYNVDYSNSVKIAEQSSGTKLRISAKQFEYPGCSVFSGWVTMGDLKGVNYPVIETSKLQLKGAHNWENICAAMEAAYFAGCENEVAESVTKNFKGLEHRLELVTEKNGIKFYNDSFSTTPETAIAAMKAFSEPEILILGGSSKKSNFENLGKIIINSTNLKTIILIGQETNRIKDAINQAGFFSGKILDGAINMKEIFQQIQSVATKGDVVILSPACASFGMFTDYKDRGNQFKKSALSL